MTLNEKLRSQLREDLLKCFDALGHDIEDEKLTRRVDRLVYNLLLGIDEYIQENAGHLDGHIVPEEDDA